MKTLAAISRKGAPAPEIEMVDIEPPRAGEILVRLVATGVCHTDLKVHARPEPKPIVLGHEGAGIIERVGARVESLKPGDHVVLSFNWCGTCPSCMRGDHSYCYGILPRNFGGLREDGTSPLARRGERLFANFFGQSSFAHYAIANDHAAVKVERDLPLELLGPLACGIQTGAGAVLNAFKLRPGQSLAVFGSGSVGLSAVMAARLAGASRIIAIDVVPARLALAKELGATDVIDARNTNAVQAIKALLPYGVDFSFNTTQVPAIYTQALECLAMHGAAGFVAAPDGDWAPPIYPMLAGGQRLQAVLTGDATPATFIPMLIDYYRQGRFPFDRLIRFYPFEKIADAFHDSATGSAIKPVLLMPS